MKVKQSFILALKSVVANKMRSFLTMLGIIIGVAAVIVLVSLIGGFQNEMTSAFSSLGTNLISVTVVGRGNQNSLSPDELYEFAMDNTDLISAMSPVVNVSATVKAGSQNLSSTVSGIGEDYYRIRNYAVGQGRFVSYSDIQSRQRVCVVGTYIARELFGGDALGQEIRINGTPFTVVGVLEQKEDSTQYSGDDIVFIPYSTAMRVGRNATVSSYSFSGLDVQTVESAKAAISSFLYGVFGDTDAYRVTTQSEILDQIESLMGTLSGVLVGIAGISLFVGGIGIMNIMLVSVTERTREIGIRKSVGGKRRDIMRQFVIEAAATSAVGGIVGIILGYILSVIAGNLIGINAAPSVGSIALAFSVSVAIGLFFGYYPASKASKLNPIDALRHD